MSLTRGPIHGKPCRCVRVRARCAAWTLPPIDVWLAPTVRGEWVAHCAGRFVEWPLSQPGYPRGDGRLKVSNSPQRGQYVVGSNRHRDVADDRLEYDTWRLGVRFDLKLGHGFPGVEGPQSGLGHPLDFDATGRPKRVTGRLSNREFDVHQLDAPMTCLEALGEVRCVGFDGINHIQARWQSGIEGCTDGFGIPRSGQADFRVLGLACRPRRRGVRVRDFRVRAKPRTERNRQTGPADASLESPLKIPMTGKPQPAATRVPDANTLGDRRDVPIGRTPITHRWSSTRLAL